MISQLIYDFISYFIVIFWTSATNINSYLQSNLTFYESLKFDWFHESATLLYGTVRYGTESLNIRTVLNFNFMLLIKQRFTLKHTHTHTHTFRYSDADTEKHRHINTQTHDCTVRYGTDIWLVMLLSSTYSRINLGIKNFFN